MIREPALGTEGAITQDNIRVHYQVFGNGPRAVLLLPTWSIATSGIWVKQVSHLAGRYTVITFDGRGNGASDRPVDPKAYAPQEFAQDALRSDPSGTCEGRRGDPAPTDTAGPRLPGPDPHDLSRRV